MKQGYTHIAVVLDRSGSMEAVRTDTIGGFNAFLAEQQKAPSEADLTLTQFDTAYDVVHSAKKLTDVPPLTTETYVPRGGTALLDAIGRTINEVGARLAAMPEDQRPAKVIFVIITDGEENSSKEFTKPKVLEMIQRQTKEFAWELVFLGANQDAIQAGASMGVSAANSMTYADNAVGTRAAFRSTSSNILRARSGGTAAYTSEDRKTQQAAGASH